MAGSVTLPGRHPLTAPIHSFAALVYLVAFFTLLKAMAATPWFWFFIGLGILFNLLALGTKRYVSVEGQGSLVVQINKIGFFPSRVVIAEFKDLSAVILRVVRVPSDYTGNRSNVVTDIRFRTKQTRMLSFSLPMPLGTIDSSGPKGILELPPGILNGLREQMRLAQMVADMIGCPLTVDSPDIEG